ncbi:hypothetical protein [Nocardia gipuzkoensis]
MNQRGLAGQLADVRTVQELAAVLKQLLDEAGWSLRKLQQWGTENGVPLPRATVHDVLAGRRPPAPELLEALLGAVGMTDDLQTRLWRDALERVQQSRSTPRERVKSARNLHGRVSAAQFFVEEDQLNEITRLIQRCEDEVWLWGATLSRHIPYLESYIKDAVERDCRVKILLIKLEGAAMTMSGLRAGPDGQSIPEQQARLKHNLRLLDDCAHPGLEVRLVDYLAPYTLYAYDPGLGHGKMDLRLGSFHGQHELRPTFQLHRERDGDWFDYFYEQFTVVWKAAEPTEGTVSKQQ